MEARHKREVWLDALKGFTILMVVIAHIANGYLDLGVFIERGNIMVFLSNVTNMFIMPLFFLLSGCSFGYAYLDNSTSWLNIGIKKEKVKSQIWNIIIIYVIWSILKCILKSVFSDAVLVKVDFSTMLWIPLKAVSLYWYLYVLIICYLLSYWIIVKRISLNIVFSVSVIACTLQYWLTYQKIESYTIVKTTMYFLFFFFGVYITKRVNLLNKIKLTKTIIFNLTVGICLELLAYVLIFKSRGDGRFIWSDIPVVGSFIAFMTSVGILGIFLRAQNKTNIFSFLGRYSLEIYLLHTFIIVACRKILIKFGIRGMELNFIISLTLAIMLPVIVAWILKRFHLYELCFKPYSFGLEVYKNKKGN